MRVLVVEDEPLLACGLKQGMELAGFTVDHAGSAEIAQTLLDGALPDAAVVDIGLPRADGLSLIRWMRSREMHLPVLVLTARDGLQDCVDSLNTGADDFMVKPYRLPEVIARVRALIRRANSRTQSVLHLGALSMNCATRQVTAGGVPVELSPREWSLLEMLMMAAPNVLAKDKLLSGLAGWDSELNPNAIEVYISRLRNKLGESAGISIRTVRGLGYRLEEVKSAAAH
ncbi:MAG TPA: response regulator transcription factor [Burkholderiaceae bacterium]|nr:response regulator transcription factor [Burkholderiaceae bacterium]